MIAVIDIQEICRLLNYDDPRGARNWCAKHGVSLVSQGKQEYALRTQFVAAFEQPFLNQLKGLYGDNWQEVYNLYQDGNVPAVHSLQKNSNVTIEKYRPQSEYEKKIKQEYIEHVKHKTTKR